MRKGDETRQQILQAAERLFCMKGFDGTSVQDILDAVHGSKGGFYHHFVSKEDLLRAICAKRAEAAAERARAEAAEADPLARLDRLLRAMMPFASDDLTFMCMLISILDRPESTPVRVGYQEALAEAFGGMVQACIDEGTASGALMPVDGRILGPVLTLVNACWADAALLLLREAREGRTAEPAALLERLDTCRRSLEALLDAPYGSLTLLTLDDWYAFAGSACRRMKPGR